jgi:hypothetical protein
MFQEIDAAHSKASIRCDIALALAVGKKEYPMPRPSKDIPWDIVVTDHVPSLPPLPRVTTHGNP